MRVSKDKNGETYVRKIQSRGRDGQWCIWKLVQWLVGKLQSQVPDLLWPNIAKGEICLSSISQNHFFLVTSLLW